MVIHREFTNQNGGINRKYPLVIFHSVGNFIIPTDVLNHFSEGWVYHQPAVVNQSNTTTTTATGRRPGDAVKPLVDEFLTLPLLTW